MSISRRSQATFFTGDNSRVGGRLLPDVADYWAIRDRNTSLEVPQKDVRVNLLTGSDILKELLDKHRILISNHEHESVDNLAEEVKVLDDDTTAISTYINSSLSYRIRFLLHRYLLIKNKKLADQKVPAPSQHNVSKIRATLAAIFDVVKKFIDIIDDVWSSLKNTPIAKEIIDLLNPFLVGAAGGIINVVESVLGIKRAYKAYNNKNIGQRKFRIGTGVAVSILGAGGTAAAIMLILSGAGIAVAGAVAMPVVIPGTLLGIYSLMLLRKAYTFHRAKQEEAKAEAEYKTLLHDQIELNNLQNHSNVVHTLLKKLQPEIASILARQTHHNKITAADQRTLDEYKSYLELQEKLDTRYNKLEDKIEQAKTKYQHAHEERLKAERKVGLGTAEVIASSIVLAGTILGLTALLGVASVASFGVLPLALIIIGVVIGVSAKIFEKIDNKNGNKLSAGIRGFFSRLFSRSPKSQDVPVLSLFPRSDPVVSRTARQSTASIVAAMGAPAHADVDEKKAVSSIPAVSTSVPVNGSSQPNSASLFSRRPYDVALVRCPDGVRRLIPQTNGVKC